MKKGILSAAAILFFTIGIVAQTKLAYIYGHDEYNREQEKSYRPPVQLFGDSVLIVSSAVLMNVAPDKYSITFGASQTASTPLQAGKLINDRIAKFKAQLKKAGIADNDIYVDFISQNKIYDYDVSNDRAIEKEAGFEIKKNITIMLNNESLVESMTEAAAEQQIFDVIRLEALLSDYTPYYRQLFGEAVKLIKDRQEMYVAATGMELLPKTSLNTDNLTIILPRTQYKQYTAYETASVDDNYSNRLIKKQLRKSSTAYYEGVSQHAFDKIINNNKPGVFIQLALGVSFKYYLKK